MFAKCYAEHYWCEYARACIRVRRRAWPLASCRCRRRRHSPAVALVHERKRVGARVARLGAVRRGALASHGADG